MRGLTIITALALASGTAHAFSIRVHTYGANLVAADVVDDGKVDLGTWGNYTVDPDVRAAIQLHPSYFRAGAVGPDGYPDIFTGQAFTHGNQSKGLVEYLITSRQVTCQRAVNEGWCGSCDATGKMCTTPKDDVVPYRFRNTAGTEITRPHRFWRSIDWAHALIDDARAELIAAGPDVELRQQSLQALAFAFGYLTHYAGDGFAHQWVNLYAEGAWDYLDENLKPEYRHVTLERYIEFLMEQKIVDSVKWNTRKVDVPVWFIRKYIVEKYIGGCTIDPKARTLSCDGDSAASKAAHIRFVLGYREALEKLRADFPAPPPDEFTATNTPIDVKDPSSYSSIWSYMVNRCIYEVAAGGFLSQGNCMERIFLMALHTYITNRIDATNRAIDRWIALSNEIVQDMLDNGVSITAIQQKLYDYQQQYLLPMFVPGPNEPVRQWFGLSCKDVGPKNFEAVCDAVMAEVRLVFQETMDQIEAAFMDRMKSWLDAYDRYLCALDKLVQYYTQPEIMMNWVFCPTAAACDRSTTRKAQVRQDVLSTNMGDDFAPFKDMLLMSKLALVGDQKRDMTGIVNAASSLGVVIDPTTVAFVNDYAYERILFESIATLDGSQPIEEDIAAKGGVHNPDRVVYDQFRKAPQSALLATPVLDDQVYKPMFDKRAQDPDGDQIILAYDLCPCAPEVLSKNALDADNDRIGDTCDPDTNVLRLASIVAGMPATDFTSLTTRNAVASRFQEILQACDSDSTAKAKLLAADLDLELDALEQSGKITSDAARLLHGEVKNLATLFDKGAMACADNKLPRVVTSCP